MEHLTEKYSTIYESIYDTFALFPSKFISIKYGVFCRYFVKNFSKIFTTINHIPSQRISIAISRNAARMFCTPMGACLRDNSSISHTRYNSGSNGSSGRNGKSGSNGRGWDHVHAFLGIMVRMGTMNGSGNNDKPYGSCRPMDEVSPWGHTKRAFLYGPQVWRGQGTFRSPEPPTHCSISALNIIRYPRRDAPPSSH